ncbi:hypothetical protein GGD56_007089 [Rhizobium mongolense]|uniref:Uncharacterized protein n=2 Tax=Rhizobium mongolense TaxID=57676 RepID=A0ABR6IZ38_9HYPH|nr:hypothetical protein [Rhizobium mongolense]TVZ64337.1 hypothetical protein BCL32_4573 [Rhizobium mongolense USDA 1844]
MAQTRMRLFGERERHLASLDAALAREMADVEAGCVQPAGRFVELTDRYKCFVEAAYSARLQERDEL